jgi:ketosteroid isomerase-like protein
MTNPGLRLFIALLAWLPWVASAGPVDDVLAADSAFAARASQAGQRAAFAEYLATDAVLFRPEAVNGQQWLATHEPATGRLEWSPVAAGVACTGRLAISSGPWRYSNDAGGEAATGHYLSVWRLGDDDEWHVVLDHGVDHASGAAPSEALASVFAGHWGSPPGGKCKGDGDQRALGKADADLNASVGRDGLARSLQRVADDGVLLYRDDAAPTRYTRDGAPGDARFERGAGAETTGMIFEPGGDLAVTHGVLQSAADGSRAVYVRVWQYQRRRWRLAIDLQAPLPAP